VPVNLTAIPVWGGLEELRTNNDVLYPTTRVRFSESADTLRMQHEIFDRKAKSFPRGKKIILRERGDAPIDRDPYGEKLTYIVPRDLKKFTPERCSYFNKWDKNALQFLRNLPGDTMIILFWH